MATSVPTPAQAAPAAFASPTSGTSSGVSVGASSEPGTSAPLGTSEPLGTPIVVPTVTYTPPAPKAGVAAAAAARLRSTDPVWLALGAAVLLSAGAAAAYHGYKRNDGSKLAAVGWGLGGIVFPPVLLSALQQGYAEPSEKVYLQRILRDVNGRPDLLASMHECEFGY